MIEPGIVTKIEGQTAYVLFKRTSACGSCKACGMLKDMSEIIVDVPNSLGAKAVSYTHLGRDVRRLP